MQKLLRFPAAHQSQKITRSEWKGFVALLRDYQEVEVILAEIKEEVEARRESILRRLERGGMIEGGGRIAGVGG